MQVFAIFLFVAASVSAKGSGPYLPSGWKPDGPAFYLPSEVQKAAENPLQDVIFADSEGSGSDALREYGPPKIQLKSPGIVNQGLPDVAIEQNFIEAVFTSGGEKEISKIVLEKVVEESTDQTGISLEQSEVTTESQVNVEISQASVEEKSLIGTEAPIQVEAIIEEISEKSLNGGIEAEVNTEGNQFQETTVAPHEISQAVIAEQEVVAEQEFVEEQKYVAQDIQEVLSTTEINEKEILPESTTLGIDVTSEIVQKTEEQISNLEQIVLNIPEELTNLENVVKSNSDSQVTVDSSSAETSGSSEQLPEGFLEYGPPGFKEYGPPKEDLNIVSIQGLLGQASVETNEARRRRFSPKFKPAKKAH